MGIGYALGGAASGFNATLQNILDKKKNDIAARTLGAKTALQDKANSLTAQKLEDQKNQNLVAQGDKIIANHVKIISDIIKHGQQAGNAPTQIGATVAPLLEDIDKLSLQIGRDSKPIHDQVSAMLSMPAGAEAPKAGSTLESIKAKMAKGEALTPGEQSLYNDSKRQTSLDSALISGLLGDQGAPAAPSEGAPTAPSSGASTTIPPVPANLVGKNPMWSPSQQKWYAQGGVYNLQGVPVP